MLNTGSHIYDKETTITLYINCVTFSKTGANNLAGVSLKSLFSIIISAGLATPASWLWPERIKTELNGLEPK